MNGQDPTEILNRIELDLGLIDPALRDWNKSYFRQQLPRYAQDLATVCRVAQGPVLEVGSTPCHITAAMQLLGYDVIGVDMDPGRVKHFVSKYGLQVRTCDIERSPLPFEDARFNFVMFSEVFEHLRIDPLFTMGEIARVLRPGGRMMLTTPNLYSGSVLVRLFRGKGINNPYHEFRKLHELGHMGHIREYCKWEVMQMIVPSGLRLREHWYRSWSRDAGGRSTAWLVRGLRRLLPILRPFQVFIFEKPR